MQNDDFLNFDESNPEHNNNNQKFSNNPKINLVR